MTVPQCISLNIERLKSFALNGSGILNNIPQTAAVVERSKRRKVNAPNELLHTIQVMFAPLLLSFEAAKYGVYGFPDSQRAAYATRIDQPLFKGLNALEIDMEWVLHQINFWKYHMVREEEATLFTSFANLEPDEKPRLWEHAIASTDNGHTPQHIGRIWKTCFAFLVHRDLALLREGLNEDNNLQDTFEYEACPDAFPECLLAIRDHEDDVATWPALFERHLHSLEPAQCITRVATRAQRDVGQRIPYASKPAAQRFTLDDFGPADHEFHGEGWMTALPAQNGIPGWRRLTMMKYDPQDPTWSNMWAYEGVILPGGMIIIGRWWEPEDQLPSERVYSGPFIMWCVDSPKMPHIR